MKKQKAELRKKFLAVRKNLTASSLSYDMLTEYEEFRNAQTVFCYVSSPYEICTHDLLWQITREKTLTVPYCTDDNGNMIAVKITDLTDLSEGRFGISEPKCPVCFPKENIDFVIVPGIAFSHDMYRLGYGKGYYDRFLSDISPFRLGVCKKELFINSLPHDAYDVKMDKILVL